MREGGEEVGSDPDSVFYLRVAVVNSWLASVTFDYPPFPSWNIIIKRKVYKDIYNSCLVNIDFQSFGLIVEQVI